MIMHELKRAFEYDKKDMWGSPKKPDLEGD
jgi:hypothetical protein